MNIALLVKICETEKNVVNFGCLDEDVIVTEYDSIYVLRSDLQFCEDSADFTRTSISNLIQNECLKSKDRFFCSIDPNLIRDILFAPNTMLDPNIYNNVPIRVEFNYKCEKSSKFRVR